ncbi:MAG: hemerythrin domain-containing protein [Chromatiales bacterium]|jgi:hemerythrin
MSDYLVWHDNWLIGIDEFDADHMEMVRLINRLADPSENSPVLQRLEILVAHMRAHFEREERFLDRIHYPELSAHANEHIMELAEFTLIKRDLIESGAAAMDDASLEGIKTWFFNHAVAQDRLFADYFRNEYTHNQL